MYDSKVVTKKRWNLVTKTRKVYDLEGKLYTKMEPKYKTMTRYVTKQVSVRKVSIQLAFNNTSFLTQCKVID